MMPRAMAAMGHLVGDLTAVARLISEELCEVRSLGHGRGRARQLGGLTRCGSWTRSSTSVLLQENAQIVIRPIFTWPDGKLNMWMIVNWPN